MFAVVKTGGKQYKVQAGDVFEVEKLSAEAGTLFDFTEVLSFGEGASITLGTPLVKGASVAVEILDQKKGDKVIIFKKKRRHNYRRKRGHRQQLSVVRVLQIVKPGETRNVQVTPKKEKAAPAAAAPKKVAAAKPAAEKKETKPKAAAAPKKAAAPKAKKESKE